MKIITITYISSRKFARLECDRLLEQHSDIELAVLTSGANPAEIWLALARSEVAVIDEEMMLRDEGYTLDTLVAGNPNVKFLAVMKNYNEETMLWAIYRGVRGVMLRRELPQLLGKAIKQIRSGEVWIPRQLFPSFREVMNWQEAGLFRSSDSRTSVRSRLH
jgi:DNA-binding NarL/FixJ family response regulator